NGTDCNNIDIPTGDADPYFISGDVLDDLDVKGSAYNEGFRVYRDSLLTDEIADISSELIVNGDTYYFTQTVLGCESAAFEVNPIEFDCEQMGVDIPQEENYVCAPGGEITLIANNTGLGDEIYWYDTDTEGKVIGRGEEVTVDVDEDTSFWAAEVWIDGEDYREHQAEDDPTLTNSITNNAGLFFEVYEPFTLEDVTVYSTSTGGNIYVEIEDVDNNNNVVLDR